MADSATVSTVHNIAVQTETKIDLKWEDYIGKEQLCLQFELY